MVDALLVATVLILGGVALVSGILALRNRLAFKIARRNIRRARTRTILVVLGLLVATAIVSGSLVVGDTVSSINVHYAYVAAGYTDEAVYGFAPAGGYLYFSATTASDLANRSAAISGVAGATVEIVDRVQVIDRTTSIPQTNLNLVGADPSARAVLGSFTSVAGGSLPGPGPGSVYLDRLAANDLKASVGDALTVYGGRSVAATVGGIVEDDLRGGVLTAGLVGGSVFADVATAQTIMNTLNLVNFLAVTNVGSQVDGVALTTSVSAGLNTTLSATPGTQGLSVHNVLKDALAAAEAAGAGTETAFLAFGLFSILAGAMLIVGIFTMIAEERKGEMGMLRAIGLKRSSIVLSYYLEGLIYAAGSALVGTFVGVLAGYALMLLYTSFVPNSVVSGSVIVASFTYSNASLLTSYLVGFLLTLATVTVASFRVSRLNIVRALRDVPEPTPALRTYTYLAALGVGALVAGLLLFGLTYRGSSDITWPTVGGSLILLGAGLIASRFASNRIVFSLVGVGLLVWVGLEPLRALVLGTGHSSSMFVIFVFGVVMVGGALLVIAFNAPTLARALERLAAHGSSSSPVVRIGLAYPSRRAMRTSITLAIFALVLFTIVALATFTATVAGSLNDSIQGQSGGYTFFGESAQPIPNFAQSIAGNGTLAPMFTSTVPVVTGVGHLVVSGFAANPFTDRVLAAPVGPPGPSNFYSTNEFPFLSTLDGMSASAVMAALSTNASVAVVDAAYSGSSVMGAPTAHPVTTPGDIVRIANPATGQARNLTVIGVLKTQILTGLWMNPSTASSLGYYVSNGYLLTVAPGVSATVASQDVKSAFFAYGLVLVQFSDVLATAIAFTTGEITLLEVFIGLGLAVGIAALGILALRAVTERRHDLGTLRATGMTRGMVLRAFLLEYTFVTALGAAVGGLLGVLIIYNLVVGASASGSGITALYIPWLNLVIVLLLTGLLATLAVIGPSLRAARLPPALAIRGAD